MSNSDDDLGSACPGLRHLVEAVDNGKGGARRAGLGGGGGRSPSSGAFASGIAATGWSMREVSRSTSVARVQWLHFGATNLQGSQNFSDRQLGHQTPPGEGSPQ
jgi:hypothetical protein